MFKKIKATIEERREEGKAVKEIENIKRERELEELAKPVAEQYDVSVETAKKYVLVQQRKEAINKAKENRNKALRSITLKVGDAVSNAEKAREEYEKNEGAKLKD